MAGHDWLWAQVHETERSELVSTCRAALELSRLIREYTEHVRSEGEETDFTEPHPSWKQYLQQLLHIHEYIYAPVCLESGFRGLPHKVSGLFHMFHLDCPIDVPLKEYCDTIAGHTSDMGVEMSTPDFKLNDDEGPESLLPEWIDREPLREDVGDGVHPEEDDDEELFVDLNDGFGPPSPPPSPPPPEHVDKVALEKALTVYGLQHCTDDLNHDFAVCTVVLYQPFKGKRLVCKAS